MTRRLLVGAAAVLFVVAIVFRSYATARGVPLLGADAVVFLPQTLPFHERGELVNAVWQPAARLDPLGEGRMTFHGFLYPMIVGSLLPRADYPALAGVLGGLHGLAALAVGVFLWDIARRGWGWPATAGLAGWTVLLAAAGANYTQGNVGRPEFLLALLLMGAVWGMSRTPPGWRPGLAGVAVGLAAAISPVVALFAGLAFTAEAAWRLPARRCGREIAGAAALAGLVFAACFLWYPYGFADWWSGTWRMGRYALTKHTIPEPGKFYLQQYLWSGSSWFLLGTLGLVCWSGARALRRQHRAGAGPAAPLVFYATLLAGAGVFGRFVLYVPWARYNVLPLIPLGFLAVLHELGRATDPDDGKAARYRRVALTILAIASLGLPLDLLQRAHALRADLSWSDARRWLGELRQRHRGEVVAVEDQLFTLTEDHTDLVFYPANRPPPAHAAVLVAAQSYPHRDQPAGFAGFRLERNFYNAPGPALFGVPLFREDRGCGFAVYRRDPAPP